MLPHPLSNFKIQKYYQNELKFNDLRNNLTKIKDRAYLINLDEYESIGTYRITLYVKNNVTYFDSFGVEHIPKEIKKLLGNKNFITDIYRRQAYHSIMWVYFCIGFIDKCLAC